MEPLFAGLVVVSLLYIHRKWGATYLSSIALVTVCVYGVASIFH